MRNIGAIIVLISSLLTHLLCFDVCAETACDLMTIDKIESYINNVRQFQSDFTQIDSNGNAQKGKVYLLKPGKLRWEYLTPKHILILVNGKRTTYYDYELEEKNQFRTKSTIIDFLLHESINLKNLQLKYCSVQDKEYEITITPPRKEDINISLTIIIQKTPTKLKKFIIKNHNENTESEIELLNMKYDIFLNEKIFSSTSS